MGSVDVQKQFNEIPMKGVVLEQVAGDPTPTQEGRVWTNQTAHTLKTYLNSAIKTIATVDVIPTTLPPSGVITGDLAGSTWPALNVAANAITEAKVARANVQNGVSSGTAAAATVALRKLGTGADDAASGADARFTDARTPSGTIGGDLTGSTWPTLNVAANAITAAKMARSAIQTGFGGGTALQAEPALRRVGLTANDAMQGNFTIADICSWLPNNGDVDINNKKLNNVADAAGPNDAVNYGQLQSYVQGLDPKASVVAATTGNITLSGNQTIDGVSVVTTQRVLVKDQSTPAQNGIYLCAAGAWTRALDNDAAIEFQGAYVFVENGTVNAGTGWVCTVSTPPTLGTTPIPWSKFTSAASIIAGNGLSGTSTFDVNVDNASLQIVADILSVKPLGITGAMLAAGSVDLSTAANKVTNVLPLANGGTNAVNAVNARSNLSAMGALNYNSPALTAGVWTTINHTLGVAAADVSFIYASNNEGCELDWRCKAGALSTAIEIKTDIPAGRAANFYVVNIQG